MKTSFLSFRLVRHLSLGMVLLCGHAWAMEAEGGEDHPGSPTIQPLPPQVLRAILAGPTPIVPAPRFQPYTIPSKVIRQMLKDHLMKVKAGVATDKRKAETRKAIAARAAQVKREKETGRNAATDAADAREARRRKRLEAKLAARGKRLGADGRISDIKQSLSPDQERLKTALEKMRAHHISGSNSLESSPFSLGAPDDSTTEARATFTDDGIAALKFMFPKKGDENQELRRDTSTILTTFLSKLPEDEKPQMYELIKHYLAYDLTPPESTKFDNFYNKVTAPLPHLAYTAADTYLDRKHAHDEADILSQTDTSKMRWTDDGRLARAGAFGLRKAFALRKIYDTLQSKVPKPVKPLQDPVRTVNLEDGKTIRLAPIYKPTPIISETPYNWSKKAALGRLALMAANMLYQGWTRKRAQFTDNELDDLAAYNYHNGLTDEVKELQAAIKRNADIRAGVRVVGDGLLDKLAGPNADAAHHGAGIWQEFADMRHRYKLAKLYDKVRARVKEWRHANPHLKGPQAGMSGGLGGLMSMLGGMGGEGGMSPEELQQMQQMMAGMGGMGGNPQAGGMDMQQMMQMAEQMTAQQSGGAGPANPNEADAMDAFDEEDEAAFWRGEQGQVAAGE